MDINFLGLLGSLIRFIFVFKLNFKNQQQASEKNFEKEESKDVKVGFITVIIFVICGLLIYGNSSE
ncbi:hypothetical protein QWT87_14050 [Chryseobacterium sp. APV1]|uniref:DUF2970 domain-containing protein n=1 Tax=Chryseobacterium urinae TaxID=3058400 RepID=A0ABT8U4L5_9FLAO|nr:hypothetical protein [Chryseobacterium sp. APV1]MDO3426019.1 hypothetical protein [Chryseobacterium sp. APV1]